MILDKMKEFDQQVTLTWPTAKQGLHLGNGGIACLPAFWCFPAFARRRFPNTCVYCSSIHSQISSK
jgi:hypothetical protein